jgi:hypothetical protein
MLAAHYLLPCLSPIAVMARRVIECYKNSVG